jgi:hypothetical protein
MKMTFYLINKTNKQTKKRWGFDHLKKNFQVYSKKD